MLDEFGVTVTAGVALVIVTLADEPVALLNAAELEESGVKLAVIALEPAVKAPAGMLIVAEPALSATAVEM